MRPASSATAARSGQTSIALTLGRLKLVSPAKAAHRRQHQCGGTPLDIFESATTGAGGTSHFRPAGVTSGCGLARRAPIKRPLSKLVETGNVGPSLPIAPKLTTSPTSFARSEERRV